MRRLLEKLGRRRHRSGQETTGTHECELSSPLPRLPAQRSRPITPTNTDDNLIDTLGTLACLPPELRRRVLIDAFGDCTLHLDLRLASSRLRTCGSQHASAPHEHGLGAAPASVSRVPPPSNSPTESESDWEWRWYGCVCHRLLPRGSVMERRILARGVSPYIWPHHDACLRGEAVMCHFWPPGTGLCGCTIGALGWLRACRQAYVEGIEVLYSTNTFVVESRDLLDSLLRSADCGYIILQQHLAMIKSLELRLEVLLFGDASQPRFSRKSDMDKMRQLPNLAGLTTSFPNIHSLIISFSDYLYNDWDVRPAARLLDIDRLLLRPLAAALGHLMTEQETHVVVELPSNVFRDLGGLKLKEEPRGDEWGDGKGLWLRYPTESSDYWIKQGVESDLFWDCEGRPRRLSNIVNNTDRHHTHLT